jgi:hypothetical protein
MCTAEDGEIAVKMLEVAVVIRRTSNEGFPI